MFYIAFQNKAQSNSNKTLKTNLTLKTKVDKFKGEEQKHSNIDEQFNKSIEMKLIKTNSQ